MRDSRTKFSLGKQESTVFHCKIFYCALLFHCYYFLPTAVNRTLGVDLLFLSHMASSTYTKKREEQNFALGYIVKLYFVTGLPLGIQIILKTQSISKITHSKRSCTWMRAKRGICGRAWREEREEGKRGVCDRVLFFYYTISIIGWPTGWSYQDNCIVIWVNTFSGWCNRMTKLCNPEFFTTSYARLLSISETHVHDVTCLFP